MPPSPTNRRAAALRRLRSATRLTALGALVASGTAAAALAHESGRSVPAANISEPATGAPAPATNGPRLASGPGLAGVDVSTPATGRQQAGRFERASPVPAPQPPATAQTRTGRPPAAMSTGS